MGRTNRPTSAGGASSNRRRRASPSAAREVPGLVPAVACDVSVPGPRRQRGGRPSPTPTPDGGPIRQGTAGDHHASLDFLASVFHAPAPEDFWSWLDDPRYEPSDRLIVRHRGLVVAHVLLMHRTWTCGAAVLPATALAWLGCLPQYRGNGLEAHLLAAALRRAAADGSVLAVASSRHVGTAPLDAWASCGTPQAPWVCARDLMALLAACSSQVPGDEPPPPVYVRPWRHIELASLARLYDQHRQQATGASVRDEQAWQWMLSRRRHGHILIAADAQSRRDHGSEVLGYVVVRDNVILEAAVLPHRPDAAQHLLARVCRDAVEHGHAAVRLDAVSAHWLAALRSAALPQTDAPAPPYATPAPDSAPSAASPAIHPADLASAADVCFVRLLHPARAVRALAPELLARARQAGLPLPLQLGWHVAGQRHLLRVTRQTATLRPARLGRSYLACSTATWVRLLLGIVGAQEAMQRGAVRPSTRQAAQLAAALFPQRLFWRPLLDDPAL